MAGGGAIASPASLDAKARGVDGIGTGTGIGGGGALAIAGIGIGGGGALAIAGIGIGGGTLAIGGRMPAGIGSGMLSRAGRGAAGGNDFAVATGVAGGSDDVARRNESPVTTAIGLGVRIGASASVVTSGVRSSGTAMGSVPAAGGRCDDDDETGGTGGDAGGASVIRFVLGALLAGPIEAGPSAGRAGREETPGSGGTPTAVSSPERAGGIEGGIDGARGASGAAEGLVPVPGRGTLDAFGDAFGGAFESGATAGGATDAAATGRGA